MNALKNTILATLVIGVLMGMLFLVQGQRNPLCEPALILGYPDNQAQDIIAIIIKEKGGLPQTDTDLDATVHQNNAVPVKEWAIRSAVFKNAQEKFVHALRDKNATISYAIDLDVTWQDGAQGIMQWQSWRYGLVSCPLVFSRGSGPTGKIRLIALTPAPAVTQTPTP